QTQSLKGLRTRHFMQQLTIDIEQRRAVVLDMHGMAGPEFVVQRLGAHRERKQKTGSEIIPRIPRYSASVRARGPWQTSPLLPRLAIERHQIVRDDLESLQPILRRWMGGEKL